MATFRLALCQVNPTVGDVAGNVAKILSGLDAARRIGVDLVVFPEMVVSGYPPEDLLLKSDFVEACMGGARRIVERTRGLTAVFGCPWFEDDLVNAACIAHDGSLTDLVAKRYLPNYGVFDENRYFATGRGSGGEARARGGVGGGRLT